MPSEKFEIEPEEEYRKERGCVGGCLKGCFVVLLLMVIVVVGLAFIISKNWRDWTAGFADTLIEQGLAASNLPADERQEVREELQRPLDALKSGELSLEQVQQLGSLLLESPLLPSLAVTVVDTQYFSQSTLTAEEKDAGRLALRRFVRGVVEEKIDEGAIDKVLSHIADREGDQWKFRKTATDEQLRALIATAEQEADQAGMPENVKEIDPSDEVRTVIDQVMGPAVPGAPANGLAPQQ